ncbi:MAG: hypothetical protein ACO3RV_02055 [Luteolibacter sp.]
MRVSLHGLFFVSCATAYSAPIRVECIAQPAESGRHVWHAGRFQIDSDEPIPQADVERLAQLAEATARAIEHHAMPWYAPPSGRLRIAIFASDEAFSDAGGPEIAAGFYDGRHAHILLRRSSWLRETGRDGVMRWQANEKLLIHELSHLCMHRILPRLPQWLIEGTAEYLSSAHQGAGRFEFTRIDASIREQLRARVDPADRSLKLVKLNAIASLDDKQWMKMLVAMREEDRVAAYSSALLMTHYHIHGGPERREWLAGLLEDASQQPVKANRFLIVETQDVEEALRRYWSTRGLDLNFCLGGQDAQP